MGTIQNCIITHDQKCYAKMVAGIQQMKEHKAEITENAFMLFQTVIGGCCKCLSLISMHALHRRTIY